MFLVFFANQKSLVVGALFQSGMCYENDWICAMKWIVSMSAFVFLVICSIMWAANKACSGSACQAGKTAV
jgi:hypothetical protein